MKITNPGRRAGVCLAALVPLSLWAAVVQDAPKTSAATQRSRFLADALSADMQGLWRLERLSFPQRDVPEHPEVGYLLVAGSCFALEIHGDFFTERARIVDLRQPTKTEDVLSGVTQTGMHSFQFDSSGAMKTRSLIGTSSLSYGAYEFEEPGTEREYRVEVVGDVLTFTEFDGRQLTFRRMLQGIEQRDIYGRLRKPEQGAAPDGEPEYELDAAGEVKRDVFGRPVRKKAVDDNP